MICKCDRLDAMQEVSKIFIDFAETFLFATSKIDVRSLEFRLFNALHELFVVRLPFHSSNEENDFARPVDEFIDYFLRLKNVFDHN
mmetsp:Transcript_20509/g.31353  ORF Transcript_20509/g.31353 Transcript_20509/m.31353 type:complete len:86 (-) Transcript_20509:1300-1557(-)